ncbi:hypothetical protein ES703_32104 [subsurface metagenome]
MTAKDIVPLVAMVLVFITLIVCVGNDIDSGIVYTGLTIISGLGGFTIGRITRK